jgi:hypothetical protein
VIYVAGSVSLFGVGINFVIDYVGPVTWVTLQWVTLAAFALPLVLGLTLPARHYAPRRRQVVGIALPVIVLALFFLVVTTWWTQIPAFQTPVSFLMGHAQAEDNAKWLDFTAHLATGEAIEQAVPLGGPLQLFLIPISTLMAVISQTFYGGVNEVMVAANTVIYGQFALVALAPLALAPFAEARIPALNGWRRVPAPLIWAGALVISSAVLMATAYGHITWQFSVLVVALWVVTYLVESPIPRARLVTSIAVIASMTVWLPMNVIAAVLIIGWFVVLVATGARGRGWDWVSIALVVLVSVGIWQPLRSSLAFASDLSASGLGVGGGKVVAGVIANFRPGTFVDSTLFEAGGGTEKTGPLLIGLAVAGVIGAAVLWDLRSRRAGAYTRLLPVGLLAGFLVALQTLDQWVTGSAPHYGSYKFGFLVAVVVAGGCLPLALMLISPGARGMTAARWVGVGSIVMVLLVDSLLIRSIAAARPEQWSPPIPFDNPRSYWWPADVDGSASQPIADNPIGCVYLPAGAKAPSGILDSKLSEPQRVYSCTRLLAGLAGEDAGAQPMVDWLRREWLTNTRAWEGVYGYLSEMPDSVLDRPVILLDDGSNVIGLESMRSLLARFPATAWSQP